MIFIVGGAYQGKKEYAEMEYKEYDIVNSYNLMVRSFIETGKDALLMTQKFLEDYAKKNGSMDNLVIISDELGYGLVPMDKFERLYRETNGRVNCYIAGLADEVVRVVCGIGKKIK